MKDEMWCVVNDVAGKIGKIKNNKNGVDYTVFAITPDQESAIKLQKFFSKFDAHYFVRRVKTYRLELEK